MFIRSLQGDSFEILPTLEDESVDLVVTDPPYPDIEHHRRIGTTTRLTTQWFPSFGNEQFLPLMDQLFRVLKRNTHCYIFADDPTANAILRQQLRGGRYRNGAYKTVSGFKYWKRLIWVKTTSKGNVRTGLGYHYRGGHEQILFFEKGKRRLNDLSIPDVLFGQPRKDSPAGKPEEVLQVLIAQSSLPGETVLDPFAGPGMVGAVAYDLNRKSVLIDIQQGDEEVQ